MKSMPNVLAIDTCGTTGYVAVFRSADEAPSASPSAALLTAQRVLPGRETQERLMSAVAEVLDEAGLSPGHLHALAVVSGPGSFTGVRIGMAAVKGFAEALQLPVIALSRLALLASAGVSHSGLSGAANVHAWLDAGRGEIFAARYAPGRAGLHRVQEAMLTREAALAQVMPDEPIFVSEPPLTAAGPGIHLIPAETLRSHLRTLVDDAFARQGFADIALLDANYLRVPDAELALRARQAAGQRTTPDQECPPQEPASGHSA